MGEIGNWQSGATPAKSCKEYYGEGYPWLNTGDLNDDLIIDIPKQITEKALQETSVKLIPAGSILIAMYGATIGKLGILTYPATTNQACCACSDYVVNGDFLFYFLLAWRNCFIEMGGGGAQPNISKEKIINTAFPFPPINEQERIARHVNSLFSELDWIESCQRVTINLANRTKAKILDLAMQGKLVPQDPADEPAADMLRRVNPKAEIITDNPHYPHLPDNWVVSVIKSVFEINPKNRSNDENSAGFVPMAYIDEGYMDSFTYESRPWGEINKGFTHFADGDIAVAKISPCLENRKSMILKGLPNGIGAGTTELIVFRSKILQPKFALLFFKSNLFINQCTSTFNGVVGQQRVGKAIVENLPIAFPSINEQKRIVAKIEELYSILDEIEKSLMD